METARTPRAGRESPSNARRTRRTGFIDGPGPTVLLSGDHYRAATVPGDCRRCRPIGIVVHRKRDWLVLPDDRAGIQIQAQHAETVIGIRLRRGAETGITRSHEQALEGRR